MQKIGVYGGSFDPIHLGHLLLAESAREELGLDQVIFVPAKRSPLKPNSSVAGDEHRWKMLLLAIEDNRHFVGSRVELDRKSPSYTVLTMESFAQAYTKAELWLILGEDTLIDFDHWYQYQRLLQITKIAVGARPGFNVNGKKGVLPQQIRNYAERFEFFSNPLFAVSSREIRERLKNGSSVSYLLLPKVKEYIFKHRLYQY